MNVKQKDIMEQFCWVLFFSSILCFSFYVSIGRSGSDWASGSPRASWTIWPQRAPRKYGQRRTPGPPRRAGKRENMAHPHSYTHSFCLLWWANASCLRHIWRNTSLFTRCCSSHGDSIKQPMFMLGLKFFLIKDTLGQSAEVNVVQLLSSESV